MSVLRNLLMASIFAIIAAPASAQGMLDIIPQDAVFSIAVRDLDELVKKGDKFLTDTEIRVPLRPSMLFSLANDFLGIRAGLDRKKPAAILLLSPEKDDERLGFRDLDKLIVPVIPYADADAMAGNFGFGKNELKLRGIGRTNRNNNFGMYAARIPDYLYLSDSEGTLKRMLKSKPVGATLGAELRTRIDENDILLHFGRHLWARELGSDAPDFFASRVKPGADPAEQIFAKLLVESLKEVQNAYIGFRLKDGIDGQFVATVPKDGQAAKLLAYLKGKRKSSSLRGLPDGNVLFAQASSGDSAQHALIAKALFSFVLEDILVNQKFVANADLTTYLGVAHEVWGRLQGNRLAIYQNSQETKFGLFSAIAILDSDNPQAFLLEMRTLARMAAADTLDWSKKEVKEEIDIAKLVKELASSSYAIRNSASTKLALIGEPALPYLKTAIDKENLAIEALRRCQELHQRIGDVAAARRKELLANKNRPLFLRPKLTFVSNAEKRQGQSIDVINLKVDGLEPVLKDQLKQLLGGDWDKIRIGIVGKQVAVLFGSDTDLFDAALRNLQKGESGLAAAKQLAEFHARSSKDRLFEFHVSVEGILRLIAEKADVGRTPTLSSASLSLGATSLELDARVPTSEARAIARKAQEEIMK